jgi:hypothetical protein
VKEHNSSSSSSSSSVSYNIVACSACNNNTEKKGRASLSKTHRIPFVILKTLSVWSILFVADSRCQQREREKFKEKTKCFLYCITVDFSK